MRRTYGPKIKNQIVERVDTKQTVGRRKITFRDNITLQSFVNISCGQKAAGLCIIILIK